jgi:hypothetical protein
MTTTPAGAPVPSEPNATSSNAELGKTFPVRFVNFWWVQLPNKLRPYSPMLWAASSDGIYLTAWPRIAAILVLITLVFGFTEGGTHWTLIGLNGYAFVSPFHAVSFAEMFPLLLLAVFLGSLSANLGLMLVIGFALGDFFWFGVPYWPWSQHLFLPHTFYFRFSQLAAYLVFLLLAVWPLVATKFLVASAHRRLRESELTKTIMMAVVLALFIYEWTYFAPMVVKWQWSCCDLVSQLDVRYFHATTAPWLMAAAVIGVVTRRLLLLAGEKRHPEIVSRLHTVCNPALAGNPRTPRWVKAIIAAAFVALLLLGYAGSLGRAAVVFSIVAFILLCRTYVLQSFWKKWNTRVAAYPAVVRLAVATGITYLVSRLILTVPDFAANRGHTTQSFGPELAAILIGFVALLALLPNGPLNTEEAGPVKDGTGSRLPVPSAAIQVIAVIGLILLSTKRALAAECRDPACCLGGDNGLAGSAAASAIPTAAAGLPAAGIGAGAAVGASGKSLPGSFTGVLKTDRPLAVHSSPDPNSPVTGTIPAGSPFNFDNETGVKGGGVYHVSGANEGWVTVPWHQPVQVVVPSNENTLHTGTVFTAAARG